MTATHTTGAGHFHTDAPVTGDRASLDVGDAAQAGITTARQVLRSMDQPAWILDHTGRIVTINTSALTTFGYRSDDDVLGTCSHETFHHSHVDGEHYERTDCPLIRTALTPPPAAHSAPSAPTLTTDTARRAPHGADWFIRSTDVPVPVSWSASALQLGPNPMHLVTLRLLDRLPTTPARHGQVRESRLARRALYQDACEIIARTSDDHTLTPQSLVADLHVSLRHLQMAFAEADDTPSLRIRTARLDKAAALLSDGTTVAEAIRQSGFSDPTTFRRAFRRHFGTSPSALRDH